MNIIVTEVNGWSKTLEVKKAITRIGNAPSADVQLPSNSIAPLHLQVLSNPELPTGCRVVNLATQLVISNNGNENPFEPYSTQDVNDGDEIQLGEYRLTFQVPFATALMRTASSIEATLNLTDTTLQPHLVLDGILTVKNVGDQDACQFQVSLSGLPDDCFHIDPIPLLYPGAQEDVRVRFFHQITYPLAGRLELLITINAPDDYPGEELVIRQSLFIAPVFKQAMELVDDIALSPAPAAPVNEEQPVEPEVVHLEAEPEEQPMTAVEAKTEDEHELRQAPVVMSQTPVIESAVEPAPEDQPESTLMEVQPVPVVGSVNESALENLLGSAPEDEQQLPVIETADDPAREIHQELAPEEEQRAPVAETAKPELENRQDEEQHSPPAVEATPDATAKPLATSSDPVEPSKPSRPVLTVKHDALNELWPDETPHDITSSPDVQDLDLSRVKVVRHPTENYWDEN
jgi:hypothetical protein